MAIHHPPRTSEVDVERDTRMSSERSDSYVYVIFRLSGEPCYVGKGRGGRWKEHIRRSHNKYLARIFAKADGGLPIIKIRSGLTNDEASVTEIVLIAAIGRGENGPLVNMTDGGEGTVGHKKSLDAVERSALANRGRKHTADVRARMSVACTGRKMSPESVAKTAAANRGRKRTAETRRKMSAAGIALVRSPGIGRVISAAKLASGYKHSPETREKISTARLGRKLSPESIEKRSAKIRGQKRNPAAVAKTAEGNRGQKRSLEVCAKFSAIAKARVRKPHSAEARANMSIAQLASFADPARNGLRGRQMSVETRARMSVAAKNRRSEHRAKITAANIGRTATPETRAKMSASAKTRTRRAAIKAAE
jgi:hypothetical protein